MRRRSPLISAALVIAMPTIADWAAEEQRLLWLRGVRVIAAVAAAREAAKHRPRPIHRSRNRPLKWALGVLRKGKCKRQPRPTAGITQIVTKS